ncbi:chloride channel, nucleotide-sensitive, 1A [Kwoniella mangroviensis CBS 10435]|uniref:Chloride channel, nucleotide-sensitive, 1A n=1 Tax=Kwoniella mangroviensis CBS 10435 TaxID=1331196 RepID=A0A1B9IIY2_9TREE|nr:chloride channel, nucleotide-sensitive, 1A [Kwoniella mangroviensis CBS 10435]
MLSPITAPPISITPEEHTRITSSTPSSFVDIPPILRWYDEEVEVLLSSRNGGWEGWGEGKVKGKLWVNEISVAFIPSDPNITPGFNLPFPSLTLHALTPQSPELPAHLYCQVDESDAPAAAAAAAGPSQPLGQQNGNGDAHMDQEEEDEDDAEGYEGGEEEEFTEMREIRIFLNQSKLESLFQALSFCSALHDSLLPNGEPSSFFGFGGDDDDEDEDEAEGDEGQWEDADESAGADGSGRVIYFPTTTKNDAKLKTTAKAKAKKETKDEEVGQVVDQMERFLNLVDWGNVEKPKGWDDDDGEEEEERRKKR